MNETSPIYLPCTEIRKRLRTHFLVQSEVPTGHALSFPVPTRRWGEPGYAFFASPALRLAGRPMEQGSPDRWGVIGAKNCRLMVYALWDAIPFAAESWSQSILSPVAVTITELRTANEKLERLMDAQAAIFFSGDKGFPETRRELKVALGAILPPELAAQYRALAPDFWNWMEAI